jgi:hypothetical protein
MFEIAGDQYQRSWVESLQQKLTAMKTVILSYLAAVESLKWVGSVPRTIRNGLIRLWQSGPMSLAEAERVDRLCNPSKYIGKP